MFDVQVTLTSDKSWWQFWKRARTLKKGKHYTVTDGTLQFNKPHRNGQIDVVYVFDNSTL